MNSQRIFFNAIKEDRGWYFVKYSTPIESFRFANLQLIITESAGKQKIAEAMEKELSDWLKRYPIPLMVSAFDEKGELVSLKSEKGCDHLMGFLSKETEKITARWALLKEGELPDDALDRNRINEIYRKIPFKKAEDIRRESEKRRKEMRFGLLVVFAWLVVVPLVITILGWTSFWVAVLTTIYSAWKAIQKGLELMGKWKKSTKQIKQEEEDLRMRHHHYHCERNPAGFHRLFVENINQDERERIREEADSLKRKKL
jgi:hypothetical protein